MAIHQTGEVAYLREDMGDERAKCQLCSTNYREVECIRITEMVEGRAIHYTAFCHFSCFASWATLWFGTVRELSSPVDNLHWVEWEKAQAK